VTAMISIFTFQGKIRRLPYALWSLGIFGAQYLAVIATFQLFGRRLETDWRFYAMPFRSLVALYTISPASPLAGLALTLIVFWCLAALAFRRTADATMSGWYAAPVVAPIFQIPTIILLCLMPSRSSTLNAVSADDNTSGEWSAPVQGVLAGIALTLAAVAVAALVFGTYGYGMFVVSPFVIGATTAYLANRKRDIGWKLTSRLIVAACALGGVGLVVAALEGIVCIAIAAPLGLGAALAGGALGRAGALSGKGSPRHSLMGIALLPAVFASENALPPMTHFDTQETIDVAASPDAVWQSLIEMDTIEVKPGLPFRLGVAYPIRAEIIGRGIGAVRRGIFSTGVALERVTEWVPDRKLAFVVLSDPPAMHELSPYRNVHAPHVRGYFQTLYTSFELLPEPGEKTRIVERTGHEMKLDPILYWLPMARWIVHENNSRVLADIKLKAERRSRTGFPACAGMTHWDQCRIPNAPR
jgi:uncharacterized membrane protein YhaH (DUF805 family)